MISDGKNKHFLLAKSVAFALVIGTSSYAEERADRTCADDDLKPYAIEGATHGYDKVQPDGVYLEQVRQSDPAAVQCYFAGWKLGFKERFQLEMNSASTRGYISGNEWAAKRFDQILNGQ